MVVTDVPLYKENCRPGGQADKNLDFLWASVEQAQFVAAGGWRRSDALA